MFVTRRSARCVTKTADRWDLTGDRDRAGFLGLGGTCGFGSHAAPPAAGWAVVGLIEWMQRQHGCPRLGSGLSSPPLWAWRCRQGNPDASLFVFGAGARARRAAGWHAYTRRRGPIGSVRQRGALIHVGRSGHTRPHNTDCRDHNRGRCAPALRSACSCTTDTSARYLPCASRRTGQSRAALA